MVNSVGHSNIIRGLQQRLHELNSQANRTKLVGAEKLYNLLVHLYDTEGIESRLFVAERKEWNTKSHQAHILAHPGVHLENGKYPTLN